MNNKIENGFKGQIKAIHYERKSQPCGCDITRFDLNHGRKACEFHKSFPEYRPTPLATLTSLATELGISKLFVKDESFRFGLNAFKVLGGSYCLAGYIAEKLNIDMADITYERLTGPEVRTALGEMTFVTATDGNHGRGIAWTANRIGQKCVVYMPKGSAPERLENIRALGAEAEITEMNYDDTVRFAQKQAKDRGWVLVQDTTLPDYEKIPGWIMEGYTTMAYEDVQLFRNEKPTHIFLQAGVGAMAGAITAFFANLFPGKDKPIITIVEANAADCIYETAKAKDGRLHAIKGDMDTIMAGLACGEPCTIGWKILKDYADNFLSVPDCVAEKGMRILGKPFGSDKKIISGESGAVTVGILCEIMKNPDLAWLKEQLKLDEKSKVVCFSTEGDTDKENYRKVMDKIHEN